MILGTVSCSKNEDKVLTPEEKEIAVETLKGDLSQLNLQMFGNEPQTRGNWWRYLLTAAADAGVTIASCGNWGWGISASILVWTVTKRESNANTNSTQSQSLLSADISMSYLVDESWSFDISDEAGYYHNKVINNLYQEYGESLFDLPAVELVRLVNAEVALESKGLFVVPESELNQMVADLQMLTDMYVNAIDLDAYINSLKTYNPSKSEELDVLKVSLEGFQYLNPEADNGQYISRVMNIIDNSSVDATFKGEIKAGISVANASTRLWNITE
jgi:hypothetical protein